MWPNRVQELLCKGGGAGAIDWFNENDEGTALKKCCVALADLYTLLKGAARSMTAAEIGMAETLALRVAVQWKRSGRTSKLKFHILATHTGEQCRWSGNPLFTHNYREETLNYSSRIIGDSCSRLSFGKRFLAKWILGYLNDGLLEI